MVTQIKKKNHWRLPPFDFLWLGSLSSPLICRPVAVGGKVEIRPMMYVALTYDHRLIDGKEAVTFLKKIKSAVEDPRVIFLDL